MGAIATASFGVSLLIFFGYKDWSFYSPISRAWELLAGGILATNYTDRLGARKAALSATREPAGSVGAAAIIFAAITLNKESLFPGVYALLPVLGAVLIILSPNSLLNRTFYPTRRWS